MVGTGGAGPEDLLGAVAVVPETELGAIELERDRKRIKLF